MNFKIKALLSSSLLMFVLYSCESNFKNSERSKDRTEVGSERNSTKIPGAKDIPEFFNLTPGDFAVNNSNYLKGVRFYYNSNSTSLVRAVYDIHIFVKHPHVRREMKENKYTTDTDTSLIMTVKRQNIIGELELLHHSCDAKVTFQYVEE